MNTLVWVIIRKPKTIISHWKGEFFRKLSWNRPWRSHVKERQVSAVDVKRRNLIDYYKCEKSNSEVGGQKTNAIKQFTRLYKTSSKTSHYILKILQSLLLRNQISIISQKMATNTYTSICFIISTIVYTAVLTLKRKFDKLTFTTFFPPNK